MIDADDRPEWKPRTCASFGEAARIPAGAHVVVYGPVCWKYHDGRTRVHNRRCLRRGNRVRFTEYV
jgi:hypothetical protein